MNIKLKIFLVFSLISFIWGSTWLVIRASLESLSPMFSAGFRFSLASVFIFSIISYRGIKIQTDKTSVILYLTMGFFSFVIPFGLVYWAEQFVPSGLASVLFAVYPFFVLLFSYIFIPSEYIGIYKLVGIVLGFTGILVIFSDNIGGDVSSYLLGMVAIVLSGFLQAFIAVIIKKHGHHLNPLSMNFFPMAIAGFSMLLLGFLQEDFSKLKFDINGLATVVYLAFFGSVVTFTSYYWLMKRINVVMLSLMAFITPIIALILGWLIFNEQLSTRHFWGSMLVLTGLLWANFANFRKLKGFTSLRRPEE